MASTYYIVTHFTVRKLIFDDTDTNIIVRVCPYITYCVYITEFETVFHGLQSEAMVK